MPSPADLPNPGTKPGSPALQVILYRLSYQGGPEGLCDSFLHLLDLENSFLHLLDPEKIS